MKAISQRWAFANAVAEAKGERALSLSALLGGWVPSRAHKSQKVDSKFYPGDTMSEAVLDFLVEAKCQTYAAHGYDASVFVSVA